MTELTILDWVALSLLTIITLGGAVMILEWLARGDRRWNRESQCPPHEWAPYYEDTEKWGHKFVGLRCGKCKQQPDGLSKGESWFGGSGGLHP